MTDRDAVVLITDPVLVLPVKLVDLELDPKSYYPPDVYREPMTEWPKGFKLDLRPMLPPEPEAE